MNNQSGHITTYLLVFLLIVIGVLVFIFKDDIFIELEDYYIDEPIVREISVDTDDIINLEIFRDDRLQAMEKTVPYFDFNTIGRSAPVGMEDSDLPIFSSVGLRNNQPFR